MATPDGENEEAEIADEVASGIQSEKPLPPVRLREFLEESPPSVARQLAHADFSEVKQRTASHNGWVELRLPEINIHCDDQSCRGVRTFRPIRDSKTQLTVGDWNYKYFSYRCGNCWRSERTFSVAVRIEESAESEVGGIYKFGELPAFGPKTPSKLITLVGSDRELFLKGRRCEVHGLGVGAFGYYRRVVENQKDRIIGEIIRVAERIGAPTTTIEALRAAQNETQFSKVIDTIKDAIPSALLINGRNPLSLLHTALSRGLHEQPDDVCLQLAHDIRIVLAELSERLAQAMKNEAELNDAVKRLMGSGNTN